MSSGDDEVISACRNKSVEYNCTNVNFLYYSNVLMFNNVNPMAAFKL